MDDEVLASLVAQLSERANGDFAERVRATLELEKALSTEPGFSQHRMIQNGVSGAHSWTPQFAAQSILSQVRRGCTPTDAVQWLRSVDTLKRATGAAIKALYGVECTEPISISSEITLLPFASIPQSTTRDRIEETHLQATSLNLLTLGDMTLSPRAALFRTATLEPLFIAELKTTPVSSGWFVELDDAARLLSLVPGVVPTEAARWFNHDDPNTASLCEFGLMRLGGADLPQPRFAGPVTITAEHVDGLLAQYQALTREDQARLALAMERLVRARCQMLPWNRAIDLAIVLEVLFMNADEGEHSYKISLRAARILHRDVPDREKAFQTVRYLYDLRSKVVHTGRPKRSHYTIAGIRTDLNQLVVSVDELCTRAIRKLLLNGAIPVDWRGIELGE